MGSVRFYSFHKADFLHGDPLSQAFEPDNDNDWPHTGPIPDHALTNFCQLPFGESCQMISHQDYHDVSTLLIFSLYDKPGSRQAYYTYNT